MMARRATPARTGRTRWTWIALAAVLVAPAGARAAAWQPAVTGTFGGTFAVLGVPNSGGTSASLSLMWPAAPRVSFGVMLHADDAGSVVDSLRDEEGHGTAAGEVEQLHRNAVGCSWRLDANGKPWHGLTPYASGTWGYYRVVDDVRGEALNTVGSAGFSLAVGGRQKVSSHFSVGAFVRYHRLFNDVEGRFMCAGIDGIWQ